jgi:hypothetical protein
MKTWNIAMIIILVFGVIYVLYSVLRLRAMLRNAEMYLRMMHGNIEEIRTALFAETAEHIVDHYYDKESLEKMRKACPDRNSLGHALFAIHTHAECCDPLMIVYKDQDVVELLLKLGYTVKWGE